MTRQKFRNTVKAMVEWPIRKLGYEIRRRDGKARSGLTDQYSFVLSDGSFDYERYKELQIDGNKRKLESVWVRERNVEFLSQYIETFLGKPEVGICHGTRRGKEQEWFRKYLGCEVMGTEISETANQFPYTVQWDFHDEKEEWIETADFVYSNSFDHSYDPEKCLNVWMNSVRRGGLCIIEHTSGHERATQLDPFGARISEMPYLILTWGNGQFFVREILDAPDKAERLTYNRFLVIQKA